MTRSQPHLDASELEGPALETALYDLAKIAVSIARMNPSEAKSASAALSTAHRLISDHQSDHPRIGRLQKGHDLRKVVVHHYGYLIYYRVIERADLVAVVTIRHPRRARIASDA